jgi:hypothetical protein
MIKSSLMSEFQTWVQPQIKENLGHDWYNVMLDMLSECFKFLPVEKLLFF